jgi:hypothetical protein
MASRRDFLKSMVPITAALTISTPAMSSPEDDCQFHADNLALAMKRKHGGNAVVIVDHMAATAQIIMV